MRAIAVSLLFVLIGACTGEVPSDTGLSNEERGQIQAQVLAWSDQWLDAATSLDAQGVAELFDPADAHFQDGASYQPTWQAFLDHSQALYGSWDSWDGEWTSRRVDVLAPDAALLVGEASSVIRRDDGQAYDVGTVFSFVVRKKDGNWSGLFGHVSGNWTPQS